MNEVEKIALCISVVILSLFTPALASDWPQFQRDATRSGFTEDEIPDDPQIIWSKDLVRVDVTPIVADDAIYVLGGNGTVWSLDKKTGDLRWKAQMDGWVFQTSTPACDGDRIFAATDSGYLAAFDTGTGDVIWSRHLTDKRFEVPITCLDGRIYLGEGSAYGRGTKRYFCFDEDGNDIWNLSRNTSGYVWCGASAAGDYLIYGDSDGLILSVDKTTGDLKDAMDLSNESRIDFARSDAGRIRASTSYKDGSIYTASELSAEKGYAWKIGFDEKTGTFENRGWSSPVGFSTSTPAIYGGRVYLGVGEHGHPGALACINDSTGDLIWSYPVEAGVKSSPVISAAGDDPQIIFTAAKVNGSAYCIEDVGLKPRLLWQFNPPDDGYILAGAAVSDGCVYIGTERGLLYCLSAGSQPEYATDQLSESPMMQPEMTGGSLQ